MFEVSAFSKFLKRIFKINFEAAPRFLKKVEFLDMRGRVRTCFECFKVEYFFKNQKFLQEQSSKSFLSSTSLFLVPVPPYNPVTIAILINNLY